MILAKAPFRISFAGGGSDLPQFYRRQSGVVVSTTINKAIYIAIHPYFHDKIRIKYSRTEDVATVQEIEHPIVRECLNMFHLERGMEIASFADVPAGTGMGSSSAFTVALLQALHALSGRTTTPRQLAEEACATEIERVKEPIGKQDQYASAFGGLNVIRFHPDESVDLQRIILDPEKYAEFQQRLMLFYTGGERAASSILAEQARNMFDQEKFACVAKMVGLAEEFCQELENGRLESLGPILHEGWLLKTRLARNISSPSIETYYRRAREAGADGGKLLGAGGGGFLLLYCRLEKQAQVREALSDLREMAFTMTQEGAQILHNDRLDTPICSRKATVSA